MAEEQPRGQQIVRLIQEDHAAARHDLVAVEEATGADRPERFIRGAVRHV